MLSLHGFGWMFPVAFSALFVSCRRLCDILIAGHDRAEEVTLRMGYENAEGFFTLASGVFTYRLDPTHCIAEFLANSVKCTNRLHSLSHVDFSSIGTNCEATAVFDEKLTHSFQRLAFPSDWTLCSSVDEHQESLLHFSARLGLSQFTDHLLKLPGAKTAASMRNQDGEKPFDVARRMGHEQVTSQLIRYLTLSVWAWALLNNAECLFDCLFSLLVKWKRQRTRAAIKTR